jgi:hypothetical protein
LECFAIRQKASGNSDGTVETFQETSLLSRQKLKANSQRLLFRPFVSIDIEEPRFPLINENAVQHIIQQSDRDGHDGEVQVVVAATEMFQQGDPTNVEEIGESGHRQEPENQLVVFVLENEDPVSLEIEQDADDGGDEVGNNVGVIELEQMLEDKEKDIVDEQAEGRVQHGH